MKEIPDISFSLWFSFTNLLHLLVKLRAFAEDVKRKDFIIKEDGENGSLSSFSSISFHRHTLIFLGPPTYRLFRMRLIYIDTTHLYTRVI